MDAQPRPVTDDPTHFPWDFNFSFENLLDMPTDVACPPPNMPNPPPAEEDPTRDPRLFCSNFLAGRLPCSCPETDVKVEEEEKEKGEHVGSGKKRGRRGPVRARTGPIQCQVPDCQADISELKGYHRRHKVCLCCANSGSVVLDGEFKRYCQQCGKFHVLADFDEGKHSCRRKLERHNQRRRKPSDPGNTAWKESHQEVHVEEAADDDSGTKGNVISLNSLLEAKAATLEPNDARPPVSSFPESRNFASESIVSSMPAQDFVTDGGKDNPKSSHSPSYCDDKSAYSSVCPTGRISFKLYDWNPAEFPRHLRHQIFQWLANMPVELEGYIRPGCTILTVFVAMPKVMWSKLHKDPLSYLHKFIVEPGRLLLGRGPTRIYLDDMIYHVTKEDTTVVKIEADGKVPRLYNIHPVCFEAGKPMEFFACGSNLDQQNTQFLVSFGGKYLKHDSSAISSNDWTKGSSKRNFDNQLYKINTTHTTPNLFGPAFIEVENEHGLSNFIPVLIGNKEICTEIEMIQERIDASFPKNELLSDVTSEEFLSRQSPISEFIVDIGWLLKEPMTENLHQLFSPSQAQRFMFMLDFLVRNDSVIILENVLRSLSVLISNLEEGTSKDGSYVPNMSLLKAWIVQAEEHLHGKPPIGVCLELHSEFCGQKQHSGHQSDNQNGAPVDLLNTDQDLEKGESHYLGIPNTAAPLESVPFLNADAVLNRNSKYQMSSLLSIVLKSRPTLYVIAGAATCLGVCSILLHPHKIGEFAASYYTSLLDRA